MHACGKAKWISVEHGIEGVERLMYDTWCHHVLVGRLQARHGVHQRMTKRRLLGLGWMFRVWTEFSRMIVEVVIVRSIEHF